MSREKQKQTGKGETKEKAIELAVDQIEKQFGKGSIMRLGEEGALQKIDSIPTGSLALDIALGIGGVPRGRIIEIYGPEGSGKTTLTCSIIANAQRLGGVAAFIDAEHALDVGYARKIGVDVDNLLISQPDTGEQALEIAEVLIRSDAIDVIVIDSVAALVPSAEIAGQMGDSHVGLQARLMSQALRKIAGAVSKSHTCMIFTNQIRMKIGVLFGNPETTTGGNALKFYSTVRMDIRRIGQIKDREVIVGNMTRVKVVKNKVAPPFRQAEFEILYGEGISLEGDLIELGVSSGILSKMGSWFSWDEMRLGQGKDNTRAFLKENTEIRDRLELRIREHYDVTASPAGGAAAAKGAAGAEGAPAKGAAETEGAPAARGSAAARGTSASKGAAAKGASTKRAPATGVVPAADDEAAGGEES
ncbi:MAG: recombinase RecA [Candidatus Krumholzibacteria bacterium]|nr:recombinase RecA [Candidatus Krumholzibacteria bacterium]